MKGRKSAEGSKKRWLRGRENRGNEIRKKNHNRFSKKSQILAYAQALK